MHPNKIAFISEMFNAGVIPALKEKRVWVKGESRPYAVMRSGSSISVCHLANEGEDLAAEDIQAWVDSLPDGSNIVIPDYFCGQQIGEFVWEVQYCKNGVLPLAYFGGKYGNVTTHWDWVNGQYTCEWRSNES